MWPEDSRAWRDHCLHHSAPLRRGGGEQESLLKLVTELIVRIAELVEAEGRSFRHAIERLGLGLSFTVVAAVMVLLGCLLILTGIWLGVGAEIGKAWASAITGVLTLGIAAGMLWWAGRLMK